MEFGVDDKNWRRIVVDLLRSLDPESEQVLIKEVITRNKNCFDLEKRNVSSYKELSREEIELALNFTLYKPNVSISELEPLKKVANELKYLDLELSIYHKMA